MREQYQAMLVGAASVMDLTGQTVLQYSRSLGVENAEQHLALMTHVRRGQTLMFAATITVLLVAFVLTLVGVSVLGGAIAIVWTVFAFALTLACPRLIQGNTAS